MYSAQEALANKQCGKYLENIIELKTEGTISVLIADVVSF